MSGLESALVKIWFPKQTALGLWGALFAFFLTLTTLVTSPYIKFKSQRQANERLRRPSQMKRPAIAIVGNIIVGGAGKTPLLIALATALRANGKKVGVLTSGYGSHAYTAPQLVNRDSSAAQVGDETLLILRKTELPLAAGKDRLLSLQALMQMHPDLDVVLSDDGLQHEALPRDVEIVVFDERFAGNEKLLPAGPLREPLTRLNSIDFIVSPAAFHQAIKSQLRDSAASFNANANARTSATTIFVQTWVTAGFMSLAQYTRFTTHRSPLISIVDFKAQHANQSDNGNITLIAGIANPEKFQESLAVLGLEGQLHALDDHAKASPKVFASLAGRTIIMTEKDAVKYVDSSDETTLKNCWVAVGGVSIDPAFVEALVAKLNNLPK